MKMTKQRRLLSWLLVVAMVFTMLPTVFAADVDTTTLTKVTTADEFVSGKYVLVANHGYAPTYLDSGWVLAEQVTLTDGALTAVTDAAVWTLAVDGDSVTLTDSNGQAIAPKSGNTNGIQAGDYAWSWTCTDGVFKFLGTGTDTTTFASNVGSANKFRAYKNDTVSGNPNGYPSDFTLYKVNEGTTPDPDPEPEPAETALTILYTNDVHTYIDNTKKVDEVTVNGLRYSTVAEMKDDLEEAGENVLLVDAGDHIQGTAYGSMDKGKTIIELMNASGYDAATLGNHEFDYGMARTLEVTAEASFPYLSCNFYHEENGVPGESVLDAYEVFTFGEGEDAVSVAFIGITTPESFTKSTPAYFQDSEGNYIYGIAGGVDGSALYDAVQVAIDAASADADYVIALGHLGDDPASRPWTSEELIANTTGLDAFIDGHSHNTVEMETVQDEAGNDVVLTQTGSYLGAVGEMTIAEDGTISTKLVTEYDGADETVAAIEEDYIAQIKEELGQVIGYSEVTLDNYDADGNRLVRKQETNTGDFAADALYYLFDNMDLDVDVAIMNGGGVRNKAVTGEMSYLSCKSIHTFGNVACLQTVTGQQILDALEWGSRDVGTAECGGFLQVSGLTYEIHSYIPSTVQKDEKGVWTGGPTGEYRVQNVKVLNRETGEYEALDLEASYNLAGYNYTLRDLGDGFAMFDGAVNVLDYVATDYMVLANYLQSFAPSDDHEGLPTIPADSIYSDVNGAGRIKVVSDSPYDTIAEALAGETGATFTVKGVVTLVDGKNIYLQDETGGICAYMSATPSDIALGDTIIATGAYKVYNALPELDKATYVKSSGLELTAKETTIGALTAADVCTYVKLTGLEITEVYDNNGVYSNPNITVKDAEGNTIQLYKAKINKNEDGTWEYAVGDFINVTVAVGIYNTLQLRNTLPTEVEPYVAPLLTDGQKVVIYNPDSGKAMTSTVLASYYLEGADVTPNDDGTVAAASNLIWTVSVNEDGSFTFTSADGKKLSMNDTKNSLPLDEVNDSWNVVEAATEGCYYMVNAARTGYYVEWYAKYSEFSTYTYSAANEAIYALQFLTPIEEEPSGVPKAGDQVVIYNLSSKGVLSAQDDNESSPSITNVDAAIVEGGVDAANGAVVFTVGQKDGYYSFYNETYGYLCSNGTGNNAFYCKTESEGGDELWTLAPQGTGYTMESKVAKYNGMYSQYLEYYAGAYKTYSMYNVTDYDIYTFQFYSCVNESVTEGIVNEPCAVAEHILDAYVGQDYSLSFTVDAVFGVKELTVKLGEETLTPTEKDGVYTVTVPAEKVLGDKLTITVSGVDNKDVAFSNDFVATVVDEPVISDVKPVAGSQTKENKRPEISAAISNAGENPTIVMTLNGTEVTAAYENGRVAYTPAEDLADGRVNVTITVTRADGKTASKSWSFTVGETNEQLYFGQLHSHTSYSDGSGSIDTALSYISSLPDSANVDFVAFTDHSNYFDKSGAANPEGALYDMSLATEYSQGLWAEFNGKVDTFNEGQSDVVALPGFEMTWSGGPGHMNTWNTPGIVSRNNTTLNNKTGDAGMKAYYALLSQAEGADSISQFNHPGSTFGTFSDFSYWDAMIDSRVYTVEVGNGEGQIGAGGYYPSYEYYTMALDKGWHLAPTNNQDNHKGKWGNANDARDVILTDDFSEEGLYEAIRQYKVYSTEDKNLELYYTVNDLPMGTIIEEVPEALNINVQVSDPDATDSISKVEVIVNSGKTAYTWDNPTELASGDLSCTLIPDYSYYYIRVTEGDGDLAVTAPVWVGETLKLGISSFVCGTATPVTGEELTLTTTLFNSEASPATVKSITYTTSGSVILGTDTEEKTVPAAGTLDVDFKYTPDTAKVMTITATVVLEQEGVEYTYSMDLELDVLNADDLVYIGIDASHHNEYVAGNYKDSMGNFGALAAEYSVRTVQLNTSEELIAAANNENGKYKAIVLTAPSRRDGSALRNPYDTYSDAELSAIAAFNKAGGTVVLCGWGDYYESYSEFPQEDHMSAQQNKVLEALGSSIRISDDETKDNTWNGGQAQRLYLSSYNMDSFLLGGVDYDPENPHNNMYTELYSQYGGASIYVVDGEGKPTTTVPGTVTPAVYGFDTTYSSDDDKDNYGGLGEIPKYTFDDADRLMVMATEQLEGQGLIVVSGAAFLSNFEVQATISDSGAEKNYSNYKICQNLLSYLNPVTVTDIAEVQAQTEAGYKYTIEGTVTSNASGYDKDTAFFDCIYVQDDTAGICCFPVAGDYKIGDKVRITGTTDFYQGEAELQVTSIEKIGEGEAPEPKAVTAAQVNDGSVLGSLVSVSGKVVSFEKANDLIQTIMVKDANGDVARIFIDGYITTGEEVENLVLGAKITAVGLASYDNTFNAPEGPFPRIRIRNRADIQCQGECEHEWDAGVVIRQPGYTTEGEMLYTCTICGATKTETIPVKPNPFVDVKNSEYYCGPILWALDNGIVAGTSATTYEPDVTCTRAQVAAFLWRQAGRPEPSDTKNPFTDVKTSDYFYKAVLWGVEKGIIYGTSSTTFTPNEGCTRAQVAAFLWRAAGRPEPSGTANPFTDVKTSDYYYKAVLWGVENKIIYGTDATTFSPNGGCTRGQVAAFLYRCYGK